MLLELNLNLIFGSWSFKPITLQYICIILGLNLNLIFGSWSFKKRIKQIYIHMSTKTSNPRYKINFGNLTLRILTLQTTWFWMFLHDFGTKSKFNFGILILQTTLFIMYLHDLGTKSRFNFRILILQTSWFIVYLHDFGTKSRFNFWILILQKKRMTQMSSKASNPRYKINFENLTFRTLILQTT